jgi:hypothetical protein
VHSGLHWRNINLSSESAEETAFSVCLVLCTHLIHADYSYGIVHNEAVLFHQAAPNSWPTFSVNIERSTYMLIPDEGEYLQAEVESPTKH